MISPYYYPGLESTEGLALSPEIFFDKFLVLASREYGINSYLVISRSRISSYVSVRQMLAHALRSRYKISLKAIGILIGNRDHSTILFNIRQHANDYELNRRYRFIYDKLISKL